MTKENPAAAGFSVSASDQLRPLAGPKQECQALI